MPASTRELCGKIYIPRENASITVDESSSTELLIISWDWKRNFCGGKPLLNVDQDVKLALSALQCLIHS
ncbi:unnamed protein product [Urochloa humidicola]